MAVAKQTSNEICVVVLTEFKEIFCGWTTDYSGNTIKLRNARQAIYYSSDTHGLIGLAANGPARGSRIGPRANIECRKIAVILECSTAAIEAWEKDQWA